MVPLYDADPHGLGLAAVLAFVLMGKVDLAVLIEHLEVGKVAERRLLSALVCAHSDRVRPHSTPTAQNSSKNWAVITLVGQETTLSREVDPVALRLLGLSDFVVLQTKCYHSK
jgi:hypothetical protein